MFVNLLNCDWKLLHPSANLVAAGLLEQEDRRLSFNKFFVQGFPVMILTIIIATFYVVIVYAVLGLDVHT